MFVAAVSAAVAARRETGQAARIRRDLDSARTALASRDSLLAAFLGPEVHVVSLRPPGDSSGGVPALRVYWNHTRNLFVVTVFELPPPPPGRVYQLWAIQPGKPPLAMGTVALAPGGAAIIPVADAISAAGFIDQCGITLEPAGGSPAPTEPPRFIGAWTHEG